MSETIMALLILGGVVILFLIVTIIGMSWDMGKQDDNIYFLRKEVEILKENIRKSGK